MRRTNAAGRDLIQSFEQCRLDAYPDPGCRDGTGRPFTIGWGSTGPDIVKGLTWTQAQCDTRFERDLRERELAVQRLVTVTLSDNEFAALVSFSYNAGYGANGLAGSTLLRKLNAGRPRDEVADEFGKWVYAKGHIMRGLIRRRAAERDLFLTPDKA